MHSLILTPLNLLLGTKQHPLLYPVIPLSTLPRKLLFTLLLLHLGIFDELIENCLLLQICLLNVMHLCLEVLLVGFHDLLLLAEVLV